MSDSQGMGATTKMLLVDDVELEARSVAALYKASWSELFPGEKLHIRHCGRIVDEDPPGTNEEVCISEVGNYEAVLLDVMWDREPKGIEIARLIRSRCVGIPVIIVSNKVERRHFRDLLAWQMDGYLDKQDDPEEACKYIRAAIQKRLGEDLGWDLVNKVKLTAIRDGGWEGDTVWRAVRTFTRGTNPHQRWQGFSEAWRPIAGRVGLSTAFDELRTLFKEDELIAFAASKAMRGHLDHVVQVYMLGYLVSHQSPGFRQCALGAMRKLLPEEQENVVSEDQVWSYFQFAWLLAALLHDVGYALEIVPSMVSLIHKVPSLFDGCVMRPEECGPYEADRWAKKGGVKSLSDAVETVWKRLRVPDRKKLCEMIDECMVFEEEGVRKFNHGVASAVKFLSVCPLSQMEELDPATAECVTWVAVAMAVHSMKKPVLERVCLSPLSPESDPLSFLLALCDEIQEWNRARPDQSTKGRKNVIAQGLRVTRLKGIELAEDEVHVTVEYVPADSTSVEIGDLRAELVNERESQQEVLPRFLKCFPLEVNVRAELAGVGEIGKPLKLT